jgi:hypothetical protein
VTWSLHSYRFYYAVIRSNDPFLSCCVDASHVISLLSAYFFFIQPVNILCGNVLLSIVFHLAHYLTVIFASTFTNLLSSF